MPGALRIGTALTRSVQNVVESTGGLALAARSMRKYVDRATSILAEYDDSPYRAALVNLCAYVTERDR